MTMGLTEVARWPQATAIMRTADTIRKRVLTFIPRRRCSQSFGGLACPGLSGSYHNPGSASEADAAYSKECIDEPPCCQHHPHPASHPARCLTTPAGLCYNRAAAGSGAAVQACHRFAVRHECRKAGCKTARLLQPWHFSPARRGGRLGSYTGSHLSYWASSDVHGMNITRTLIRNPRHTAIQCSANLMLVPVIQRPSPSLRINSAKKLSVTMRCFAAAAGSA